MLQINRLITPSYQPPYLPSDQGHYSHWISQLCPHANTTSLSCCFVLLVRQSSVTAAGEQPLAAPPCLLFQHRHRSWQPFCYNAAPPSVAATSWWPHLLQRSSVVVRHRSIACWNAAPPAAMTAARRISCCTAAAPSSHHVLQRSSSPLLLQRSSTVGVAAAPS